MAVSNAFVSRRKLAAARALCSEICIEASCAPSMRWKATRLPPESTTATFIFQSCFLASATAAAMSASARSSGIGAPYGTSNGILSGTTSSGLAAGGCCAAPAAANRTADASRRATGRFPGMVTLPFAAAGGCALCSGSADGHTGNGAPGCVVTYHQERYDRARCARCVSRVGGCHEVLFRTHRCCGAPAHHARHPGERLRAGRYSGPGGRHDGGVDAENAAFHLHGIYRAVFVRRPARQNQEHACEVWRTPRPRRALHRVRRRIRPALEIGRAHV